MTREEAIKIIEVVFKDKETYKYYDSVTHQALNMAIEALQFAEHFDLLKEYQSLQEVVRCKDCRQYIPHDLTDDYGWCCEFKTPIEEDDFCSHGERKE